MKTLPVYGLAAVVFFSGYAIGGFFEQPSIRMNVPMLYVEIPPDAPICRGVEYQFGVTEPGGFIVAKVFGPAQDAALPNNGCAQ